jgi:hypothetical protein
MNLILYNRGGQTYLTLELHVIVFRSLGAAVVWIVHVHIHAFHAADFLHLIHLLKKKKKKKKKRERVVNFFFRELQI